jgi:hypothetical protein
VKKLISIIVTLGVVLGLTLMAAPVAAVTPGTIEVTLDNPLAGPATSDYLISFHNGANLLAADGDFIDVMFPAGTNVAAVVNVFLDIGATRAAAEAAAGTTPVPFVIVGTTALRLYIVADIVKCAYVAIVVEDVVNPASCFHHLQVGSSTHTPSASEDYTIYSMKLCLVEGKNLVSLPDYPEDESIEVVLAALFAAAAADPDFEFSVWYWDAAAKEWIIYASDTSFDDLETIEPGKAYWIKVNTDICFFYKGVPYPDDQGPPPKFCWYVRSFNMVGFSSLTPMLASVYLNYAVLPPTYIWAVMAIYDWDETTQAYVDLGWPWVDPLLQPGEGYWMAFLDAACIIPPVQ